MIRKNFELIKYIFFGILAMVLNIVCYILFEAILGAKWYLISNVLAWAITVCFAFFTNKRWVFCSTDWGFRTLKKEFLSFVCARILSLLIEEAGLWAIIEVLFVKSDSISLIKLTVSVSFIAKCFMQIIVIIGNYIFSKFIIFNESQ